MGFIKEHLGISDKKTRERVIPEEVLDYCLVGNGFELVLLWHRLQMAGKKMAVLGESACSIPDLNNPYGINLWRGEDNIQAIQENTQLNFNADVIPALFYRDQKFREFGGRSKSMPFLFQEELLTLPFKELDMSHLKDLLPAFNETLDNAYVVTSERLEDGTWLLNTSDERWFRCKELIYGYAPFKFLNSYLEKSNLSEKVFEALQETDRGHWLYASWNLGKELADRKETLFIPQSLTHEHGHFIGQFMKTDENQDKCVFMTFLDENQHSEAEIAKKIRLLKRQLGKIFPEFEKTCSEENYVHLPFNPLVHVEDEVFSSIKSELPSLHFVSAGAALESFSQIENANEKNVFGPTRALISMEEFFKNNVENLNQSEAFSL